MRGILLVVNKRYPVLIIYFIYLISVVGFLSVLRSHKSFPILSPVLTQKPIVPTPTPFIFTTYTPPKIEKKDVYKIAMIGDSMTAALGPHGGGMSEYMNSLYKKEGATSQGIIIDNFAKSSNLLAVDEQLNSKVSISEYTFEPLLSTDYDLILVESFGYNPLSEFGVEEGVKKQTEALNNLMTTLITKRPKMAIVFVTTIAPNKKLYAKKTQPNNSEEERSKQAEERIAYLVNHNAYAQSHNIPLINIYEKSLTSLGDGDTKYINATDNIHPSFAGVDFIGHTIGDYLYDNQILPHE